MKIAILSRRPQLYSTRRLFEAAAARSHDVRIINTLRCYMNIRSEKASIHYHGQQLDDIDAIIPRIGASDTFYGAAVVRQFEMMGVFAANEAIAITRSRDKLRALQLLSKKGVGLPPTGFAHSPEDIPDLIKMVGGAPLVIKLLQGTQGRGVILAETKQAAESMIDAFTGLKENTLIQQFIKEAQGCDIRCFVVGQKVVASMQRQAQEGEFRSNLHRGGKAAPVEITEAERHTAITAARIMGLHIAGVDLIRSNQGTLLLEVNSSPGLEGIEKATGVDVATSIIEFIETHAKRHHRKPPNG